MIVAPYPRTYYQPITLRRGVDFSSPSFAMFADDGITPRDLSSGASARLSLRYTEADARSAVVVTDSTSASGKVSLGGPSGLVSFSLTPAALAILTDRAGCWELLVAVASVTYAVARGTWTCSPSPAA